MKIQYLNFPSFFFVTFYYFLHFEFLYFVMILIMRADYTPLIKKQKKIINNYLTKNTKRKIYYLQIFSI